MTAAPRIADDLLALARPIDTLKPLPGNPRKGDIDAVARSYARFGQRKPIVALPDGTVIAGNHQLAAALRLGWTEIAVVIVDDDEQTARAFALADNRTSDLGTYDATLLADLITQVAADPDLLAATSCDLDQMLASIKETPTGAGVSSDDLDDVPTPAYAPKITQAGDLWELGLHRILCGDCRHADDVARLLDGARVNVAFTSPPYADRREYDESSGFRPIKPDDYVEWFAPVAKNVYDHLADDGSWFVNIKAASNGLDTELYVLELVLAHARNWGWHYATEFCWERIGSIGTPARRFKNQFEPIYQFTRDEWKFRPNAVRHASNKVPAYDSQRRWSVESHMGSKHQPQLKAEEHAATGSMLAEQGLAYPGNRLPTFAGSHEVTGHPAAFPVGLPEFFIKAYSDEGDTIFDPFMGSGSTLLAAHRQNRIAYGTELSPAYCDIICARWQRHTGIYPINAATRERVDFLAEH